MITIVSLVITAIIVGVILRKSWRKMHEIAGIQAGTPRLVNPPATIENQPEPTTPTEQPTTPSFWQTKHGRTSAMNYLVGITVEKLNLMPTEAVVILSRINDKMARYTKWQQETKHQSEQWLNEKQFAIQKLIEDSIPTAVQQYDQLARFNPHKLQQKIHGDMTASDILIQVLLEVDNQLDTLHDELYQQTADQLTTTYRYVKSRTQQ